VETAGAEFGCINTVNTADESWLSQCDPSRKTGVIIGVKNAEHPAHQVKSFVTINHAPKSCCSLDSKWIIHKKSDQRKEMSIQTTTT
jgi:hypothetical protein